MLFYKVFNIIKSIIDNKKDVFGINLNYFLVRMFMFILWGNICYCIFNNFKKGLLYIFIRYIMCDRNIFVFFSNFIYFINVDNIMFSMFDIIISSLN